MNIGGQCPNNHYADCWDHNTSLSVGDMLDPFRQKLTDFLNENKDRMTVPVLRENLIQIFQDK